MVMKQAFIINGVRTGIGSFGGTLSSVRADDLAALVLKELVNKNSNFDFGIVEDVILGCANQAGEDNRNIARMALLLANLPITIGGETVNRLCASGMSAVINCAMAIQSGRGEVYIGGGIEQMTRGPWIISKTSSAFGRDAQMFDSSFGWRFINPIMKEKYGVDAMGETAENLAQQFAISREDQDKFAVWSQQKAAKSKERLSEEIINVTIPQKKGEAIHFSKDEFSKPDSSFEKLSSLKPAFRKDGSVTAGNSSGLNDGAAALLIAGEEAIKNHQLKPLARIVSSAVSGVEPRIMGIGPVEASKKALSRAGLLINDVDLIELNEAFAAQVLACTRQLGIADNDERLNVNGGAIALGHPLGMSGARLLLTASIELHKRAKRYALCTMCIGVGQGYAVVLERA